MAKNWISFISFISFIKRSGLMLTAAATLKEKNNQKRQVIKL